MALSRRYCNNRTCRAAAISCRLKRTCAMGLQRIHKRETSSGLRAEVNAARTHDSTSVKLKMPPKSDARTSILSSITELRQRCPALQSLQAEYTVITALEVYLSQGLVQHAEPIFNKYRRQGHQFSNNVCNKMLMGWSDKGNHVKTMFLFNTLKKDGMSPDAQTYAALLHLCSRTNNAELAAAMLREMEQKGISVSAVFHNTTLTASQVDSIRQILQICLGTTAPLGECPEWSESKGRVYPSVVAGWYKERRLPQGKHGRMSVKELLGEETMEERIQQQLTIEREGALKVQSVTHLIPDSSASSLNSGEVGFEALKTQWKQALTTAIQKEIDEAHHILNIIDKDLLSDRFLPKHYPFLPILPASQWADLIVETVAMEGVSQPDGLPVNYLCGKLRNRTWNKFIIAQKQSTGIAKKVESMYTRYAEFLSSEEATVKTAREFWKELDRKEMEKGSLKLDFTNWSFTTGSILGGAMLDMLINVATIPADPNSPEGKTLPAFYHLYEFQGQKKIGFFKAHPQVHNIWRKTQTDELPYFVMDAGIVPMLVPPQPWVSVTEGGYLLTPARIVRCQEDTYQHQLLMERAENLAPVYDALDYVSSCPWKINSRMLEAILRVFSDNGDVKLDIPQADMPEVPDIPRNISSEEKRQLLRKRREIRKVRHETHALRMDMMYKLSLAKHFENKVFWLPHNMDFRGRAYPIPPHVTHLSGDVGRALLMFAEGYPIGKRGLQWLKTHLINLHGERKKAPLQERADYVDEIMPLVLDSADKPFDGKKWWQTADSPWQTLACCMELASAVRSGDPEGYISHIPVHQDGSCNGLQHYAALGRDSPGAFEVNLTPSEKPQDLYHAVAMMVDAKRKKDAKQGNKFAQVLEGKVNRKVVKQTVMTVVYGVTHYGGRLQIQKQLVGEIPPENVFQCSKYLVDAVFETLHLMFTQARKIQNWLTDCARQITMVNHPTEWVTPLGLPVVQPYHMPTKIKETKTPLQNVANRSTTDITKPPSLMKQKNAFPPNFVHSLDSTHMLLTALHCQRAGIPFVAVHDSYWTHACTVDTLNKICREQFVALHSEPILEDLANYFEDRFGGISFVNRLSSAKETMTCSFRKHLPPKGDLDIGQVLQSTYFFS